MEEDEYHGGMVTIAILVSRAEALCLTDMLNAEGIAAHLGDFHSTLNGWGSLGMYAYRVWVPVSQYAQGSDLIREVGVEDNWSFSLGARRAVLRLLGFFVGVPTAFIALLTGFGLFPFIYVIGTPIAALLVAVTSLPVNPQGRGDFYLADRSITD